MRGAMAVAGVSLAVWMAVLGGCATKAKLTADEMCKAAGGTYSTQSQACNVPAANNRSAVEMCQAHGGYYDAGAQVCEVGRQ